MISKRVRGLCNGLILCLLLVNGLTMYGLWLVAAQTELLALSPRARESGLIYEFAVFFGVLFAARELYKRQHRLYRQNFIECAVHALRVVGGFAVGSFFIYFTLKDIGINRGFLFIYACIAFPINILVFRYCPGLLTRHFFPGSLRSRAVLVGQGKLPDSLAEYVQRCGSLGVSFIGYYAEEPEKDIPLKWLGDREAFLKVSDEAERPDRVLAYNMNNESEFFHTLVHHCIEHGIRVQAYFRLVSDIQENVRIFNEGDLTFISFIDEPLEDPLNRYLKRVFDLCLAVPVVLFVLPPLALLIFIIQRFQAPGPLVYKQLRAGHERQQFTIYKFRSMYAERSEARDAPVKQAKAGDDRIYPLGRFLRRASLDELPQFINVIRGDMSVVGPRPLALNHDEEYGKSCFSYRSRHFVKPGITGYAQVRGFRGEVKGADDYEKRHAKDLYYINNWSLGLDLLIVWKTIWVVIEPPDSAF